MNSKVLVAAIVGAIFYFLLGWLIYGVLLADMMTNSMNDSWRSVLRPDEGYVIWAFGVGNLATSLLLAIIYNRMGVRTFMSGALNGFWIGALMILSFDLGMFGMTTLYEYKDIFMDTLMGAILTALLGGVVAWMLGRGNKSAAKA